LGKEFQNRSWRVVPTCNEKFEKKSWVYREVSARRYAGGGIKGKHNKEEGRETSQEGGDRTKT